jgi:polyphosphate kinase
LSLNLAVLVRDPSNIGLQFARVKIPPNVPRFIALGDDGSRFVLLEDLVSHHLDRLFGGLEVVDSYVFRVTRSADIAVEEEEADDLLQAMESVLRFRQRSARAARLEMEAGVADNVLQLLLRGLQLEESSVYLKEAPLGLSGLWGLYAAVNRPDLKDEPWTPSTQPRLAERPGHHEVDFFAEIRRGDILVHHPYGSFATSAGAFLSQAASDPDVLAIKQTLYRTSIPDDPGIGGEAAIVRHLMDAAEAGKQVVVLVELRARFDEAANISWAKMLEAAGVHVVYGVHGLKTHTKTLLVVRREGDTIRRYSHIGTGNYNPKTARIYEDLGLFTDDEDIGADLSELFNHLTGYAMPTSYRTLLVAPHTLRPRLVERIREQASLGSRGRILLKLNHIMDQEIIDELYTASQRGAKVDIIVRGVCGLRAGVPGLSDTISVRSIVGMFLEHSRIYRFGDPANGAVYYIGSADLMPRNLDGRVEALVPITDPRIKGRLEQIIEVLLADDALAWEMHRDGTWAKVPNERHLDSHRALLRLALDRARGEDQAQVS